MKMPRSKQGTHKKEFAPSTRELDALAPGGITPPLTPIAPPRERHRVNRLILTGIGSDRVFDVTLPKMPSEFPAVFSQAARAKVMATRLRAEEAFGEKKSSIREFADAEALLLDLVLQVFVAFAKEACKLAVEGVVTAGEVESECLKFLEVYVLQAGLMDDSLAPIGNREMPGYVQSRIERTDAWKKYRRLLQIAARAQAGSDKRGPGNTRTASMPRRKPDLERSRERLDLVDALASELAQVKQDTKVYCTVEGLKRKYPQFKLWTFINDAQIKELVEGEAFSPKAYAEYLVLTKYGLTSRETLKKDRRKLRNSR
jgi:hypothetical protein